MSETKFTPGPWEAHKSFRVHTVAQPSITICHTDTFGTAGHAAANARLIAAAPEMYAALAEAKEFIENQQLPDAEWSRVLDVVVAALAKAVPHV